MPDIKIKAQARDDTGSANARRLRREGKIPGVIYGGGVTPIPVAIESRMLRSALTSEVGLNALLDIEIGSESHLVVTRELQRHAVRGSVSHIDFQIVRRDQVISADVPIILVGESSAIHMGGGRVEQQLFSISIRAIPSAIPSSVSVDVSQLQIGGGLKVSDIAFPDGVTSDTDLEIAVALGIAAKGTSGEVGEAAPEGQPGESSGEASPE